MMIRTLVLTHELRSRIYLNDNPLMLDEITSDGVHVTYNGEEHFIWYGEEVLIDESSNIIVSYSEKALKVAKVAFFATDEVKILREKIYNIN